MFSWTCTCGDGGAVLTLTREEALRQGELHRCRAGRMRDAHAVRVLEHAPHPALAHADG